MFCYKCGEENPDEAKFCRNCGTLLKQEETVKKVEIVEHEHSHHNTAEQPSNGSDWIECCLCLISIFIIFAVIGSL